MPKWLRVVLIIVICLLLLLATAALLLLWAVGAFRHVEIDDPAQMGIIGGYVIFLVAGVFGIVFLARGFRASAAMAAEASAAGAVPMPQYAQPAPQAEADPEKVMHLRVAMAVKIGVSVMLLLYGLASRFLTGSRSYAMQLTIVTVASFAMYNGPYAILIALKKLEKFAIALALTLPCAFLLSDLYRISTLLRFAHLPQFILSTVISMGLEVTILVLALRLKKNIGPDAGGFIAGAAALSIVYVIAINVLIPMLTGLLYRGGLTLGTMMCGPS